MVNILNTSRELTNVEQYLMTIAPSIKTMKEVADGQRISVDATLIFEDVKEDGTTTELLSILTPDKECYTCQSATFKRSLSDIAKIMEGKPFTIIKTSGVTKAGRDFINCVLDTDSLM